MGAVAKVATPCGRFGGGSKGRRPLSLKGASRRQAQTLGFTVLTPPRVLPSAAATGHTGTLDFSPVFSPAQATRSCSSCAASLSRAAPFFGACPASSRVAARLTLGAARFVRRATDVPWACPRPRTVPGRRVRPGGRDPNGTFCLAQVPIVRNFSR